MHKGKHLNKNANKVSFCEINSLSSLPGHIFPDLTYLFLFPWSTKTFPILHLIIIRLDYESPEKQAIFLLGGKIK